MKKEFKIKLSDGTTYKCKAGEMLVMNNQGVFFLISGLGDYYMGIRKLNDVVGDYTVDWTGEYE